MASDNLRVISLDEIQKHNSDQSCWIILSGKVYDVTKFLNEHPGGEEVITQLGGQDATEAFNDVGHSRDALEMTKEYLIGTIPEDAKPAVTKPSGSSADAGNSGNFVANFKEIMTSPTWTNFLIPTTMGIMNRISRSLVTGLRRLSNEVPKNSKKIDKNKIMVEKTPKGALDQVEEVYEDPFLKKHPNGINKETGEVGGPAGPEPTRYGDWERKGRVSDF
ncbi:unnamed protein product [Caenorhabditis bovis]|uniref:Cytochrome b5 heme-binding domain-containing protein n=1 Tax=Caenorhabditis bovis TaxID=2654633 RepID=A0A8S1F3U6_9PELO|nr:unnamed protein product [Caenorhabditis bovis]